MDNTLDVKNLKIGDVYFANISELGVKNSTPYTIVEEYPDYFIGFNPEAELTNYVAEDVSDGLSYSLSKEPKYKVIWDYRDKNIDVVSEYEKYFEKKYGRSLKEDREDTERDL